MVGGGGDRRANLGLKAWRNHRMEEGEEVRGLFNKLGFRERPQLISNNVDK